MFVFVLLRRLLTAMGFFFFLIIGSQLTWPWLFVLQTAAIFTDQSLLLHVVFDVLRSTIHGFFIIGMS